MGGSAGAARSTQTQHAPRAAKATGGRPSRRRTRESTLGGLEAVLEAA
jgi:hypothetical protein